jgi:hypothetical protein
MSILRTHFGEWEPIHEVSTDITKEQLDSFKELGIIRFGAYVHITDKDIVNRLKDLGFVKADFIAGKFGNKQDAYWMELRGK